MNGASHHILLHYKHAPEPDVATHHVIKSFVGFRKGEFLHHTVDAGKFRKLNRLLCCVVSTLLFSAVPSVRKHLRLSRACPLGKL